MSLPGCSLRARVAAFHPSSSPFSILPSLQTHTAMMDTQGAVRSVLSPKQSHAVVSLLGEGSVHPPPLPGHLSGMSSQFGISIKPPCWAIFVSFFTPLSPTTTTLKPACEGRETHVDIFFFLSLVVPLMINRECGTCALPT